MKAPRFRVFLSAVCCLVIAGSVSSACSRPDSGIQKSNDVTPPADAGGAGASGTTSANPGGTEGGGRAGSGGGGASAAGSGGSQSAGAAGSPPAPVDCTKDLPGSPMVRIERADKSSAFCIDAREATQADYAAFLAAVPAAPSAFDQDPWCKTSNPKGYKPQYLPFSDVTGPACGPPADWNPGSFPNRPVACVDWCDAAAYCAWAGKRLCGVEGGGAADVGRQAASGESEWVYTCAEGDVSGIAASTRTPECLPASPLSGTPEDVDKHASCAGKKAPFDAVQNLEGNAGEWTAECEAPPTDGSIRRCLRRGGGTYSPVRDAPGSVCAVQYVDPLLTVARDLGFRCCAE